MKNMPYIKTFSLCTGDYIYDVNKNSILKINDKKLYNIILQMQKSDEQDMNASDIEYNEIINTLKRQGYLLPSTYSIIENKYCDVCSTFINNCIKLLVLQVTQKCNLNCGYCPYAADGYIERTHSTKEMTWEISKKAVDFLIEHSKDSPEIGIGFYGGEPLLNMNLVEQVMEYASIKSKNKEIIFLFTTNGILLNSNFIERIKNYNFNICISLDGPIDVHNKYRRFAKNGKGSFDIIYRNIADITNKYPEFIDKLSINAVRDGVCDMNDICSFFLNDPIISKLKYEITPVNDDITINSFQIDENNMIEKNTDLANFIINKITENKDIYFSTAFAENELEGLKKIDDILSVKDPLGKRRFHHGPCIPGCNKLFVDVDGNIYPCEKESASYLIFGNINFEPIIDLKKVREMMNNGYCGNEMCGNCWAFRFCGMCIAHLAKGDTFSPELKKSMCHEVRYNTNRALINYIYLNELGYKF